ncbi:hypothetical protein HaLaN_09801 [Haematococcus lacustris]|uniref:Uncharacterized protein n=1 Tax=Haematococcus lacustris TaxID=44745 RepID=A0A699Z3K5_HAELA|nr:hypothetical protein HaLaN_09801 [Haematococcus lacustris]
MADLAQLAVGLHANTAQRRLLTTPSALYSPRSCVQPDASAGCSRGGTLPETAPAAGRHLQCDQPGQWRDSCRAMNQSSSPEPGVTAAEAAMEGGQGLDPVARHCSRSGQA